MDDEPGFDRSTEPKIAVQVEFQQFVQKNFALVSISGVLFVFAMGLVWFLLYSAWKGKLADPAVSLMISLALFVVSSVLSYVLTAFGSQITRKDELRVLGQTSATHLALLRSKINTLGETILSWPTSVTAPPEVILERLNFIEYTLRILAYDAGASTSDIASMAKLERVDVDAILSDAEIKSRRIIEKVTVNCPQCLRSTEEYLPTAASSTRHLTCVKCNLTFTIHRLPDGTCLVAGPAKPHSTKHLANQQFHPNTNLKSAMKNCPGCDKSMKVNVQAREIHTGVKRNCFECFEMIEFDPITLAIKSHSKLKPTEVEHTVFVSGRGTCPNCLENVGAMPVRNSKGQLLQSCPNCGNLHLILESTAKQLFRLSDQNLDQQKKGSNEHNRHRNCPNISCGASVSFKVHDGKDFSLKFCYECYSRLKYIYRSDIVEVEEKIVPKSVTKEDISKDGLYCPYCLTEADGASTRNSRGERLAVCWGCKGLFKYTD